MASCSPSTCTLSTHTPCTLPTHCSFSATHPQHTDRTTLAISLHSDCALPTHCPRTARTLPESHNNLPTQSHPPPALNCPSAHCPHTVPTQYTRIARTLPRNHSYPGNVPTCLLPPHCWHSARLQPTNSPDGALCPHAPALCPKTARSLPALCLQPADNLPAHC